MKVGLRGPSPRKMLAARVLWRRAVQPRLGVKAPWGSLRNTGPSRDWARFWREPGRFVHGLS